MSTSGGGSLNGLLYVAMLACAVRGGREPLGPDAGRSLRVPVLGFAVLWLTVAVPSLLQIAFGGLLGALERDPEPIRHHDQWWRLVTSGVVQGGGIAGTLFDLAVLAVVGVVAVRVVWAVAARIVVWGATRSAMLRRSGRLTRAHDL